MTDIIFGYKAFNEDLINRYGQKYELNKLYHYDGDLKFGNDGHGFHMCENLEDCLRFFEEPVQVASVMGFGNSIKRDDDYSGTYDMYVVEYIIINEILTRNGIINYMLLVNNEDRIINFLSLFKLTDDEKVLFVQKFSNQIRIINSLKYYQCNDKDIWNKFYKKELKK